MNPTTFPPIPFDTARAARAIFGISNFYLTTGDQANQMFDGLILEDPAERFEKPARTVAMLYLITIFQYVETLPDHLAGDALRKRIDWKYALHLPLNYPGLEAGSFCQFRRWVLSEITGQRDFQTLLQRWSEVTNFGGKQRTGLDSGQVIATVCQISRLTNIWELLHQAMEALATKRPDWLLGASLPHWYARYGSHRRNLNLRVDHLEMQALAHVIGADGTYLLEAISDSGDPELSKLAEVVALRELWREQFEWADGQVRWRKKACAGCSVLGLSSH